MRLNIGCGQHYAPGWTNTDLHQDGPRPDAICSVLDMPFDTGSAQQVYCGHVLEHVATTDLPRALSEIHRVLAPTGELVVVGPDIDLTMRYEPLLEDGVRHGGKRWPGDEHLWVPTGALTLRYVEELFDAHLLDIEDVSDDWPVVGRDPWQFALTATPKRGGEG